GDFGLAPQAAGADAVLLLEQVRTVGLAPAQSAGAGDLEALGSTPVGLHLRHVTFLPRDRALHPLWPPLVPRRAIRRLSPPLPGSRSLRAWPVPRPLGRIL